MQTIGVIGAGAMGAGIAQVAASAQQEVVVYDSNQSALIKARDGLIATLNKLAEKGKLTDADAKAIFGRIFFADSLAAFSESSLVIEAIVENLDIKKSVFQQLENVVSPDCILASNTSSLSITSIAGSCQHPERVLGIHFFNPAPLMRLVEIVPALQTKPEVTEVSKNLITNWGKLAVLTKDTPGFIVNRVARPFYSESIRLYEEGFADFATIDWALKQYGGFKMGPFELMDFIGNDVNYAVTESVWTSFFYDPRYKPSFTQKRLVEAGWLGRKSGRGYYDYAPNAHNPEPDTNHLHAKDIFWRVLVMLINEAADALYLQIASKDDLELAMTTGVNYPKGLLQWADEVGIRHCVATLDRLHDEYHEDRYRCSPLLRQMAESSQRFFE